MVNRNATVRTMPSFRDEYDFQMDMEDVDLMMNPNDYIPIPDQDNNGTAYIRISLPELNVQKCLQFQLGESIWHAKQQILASFGADLRDGYNYGLYCPPQNGKAGKFLDEERLLKECPLAGPIGYLEFKFKRRVYRSMELDTRKLKQIHTKANLKQFMDAVKHSNKEKVDKYVTKGLDPNYVDIDSGESPLSLSCTLSPEKCRSMIITLVSGGAHMDFRDRHGFTPMHKGALTANSDAIKTLLDLGASPNYKDLRYLTPLYYAVTKDDPVCTEMLLNERAIIGTTDEQGWFEIHQACRGGKVQALEHLIYYGADMDVQNASGNTPLHVCAVTNQESCARVLLFRGANKVIVNLNNQTPYEAAIIGGNLELAEIIKGHSSAEIVPFRELPQYSSRRKLINYTANFRTLAKCRSESRLNLSMMDNRFFDPDGSYHQYSTSSDCYSITNSDSPRSMSSSSIYSGPANNRGSGSGSYIHAHHHHHPHQRQKQGQQVKTCSRRRLYAALPNRVFICTKKFKPIEPGDLKLKKGHLVKVLHVGEHGYYEGRRENGEEGWFPCSTVEEINLNSRRRRACSVGDLDSDTEYFQRKTIQQHTSLNHMERSLFSDYAPRAVVLRKGPNGFGFVLRGAKCDSPGFRHPPNDAPAMQYLDTVDKGSVADKAGLKGGDFILEINGKNVTRASHEYVVNLIKTSGNSLTMNVLTVKPTERDQNWYVHQDGSMTLPHRRRQAPEPPRRDPKTSLSFSKAKSKSFAEGMAEIEKLDQALAEYDVSDTPSGESVYGSGHKSNGAEIKTASIRAGYAKKRVSSVELENLCRSNSPHKPEHLSPSEVRIKKYHKKQSNLEKSQSTPNLAQNLEEQQLDMIPMINTNQPMYRTVESSGPSDYSPYSSCSSGPSKYTQRLHPVPYMSNATNAPPGMDVSGCRHSVAIGSNVQVNSLPSRGKGRNVAPPVVGQNNAGGKPPAPAPPPQVVKISTNKEQPVYASVVNGAVHHTKQPAKEENPYESSFRPGTVAMFGNKTPVVTPSALSQVKLRNSKQNDSQNEKPTQNAMLVTADVHASSELKNKQKRNSSYYEPEPDYESEHEDGVNKQSQVVNGNSDHKTVISINNNTAPQTTNGYAIPQPPQNGPNNPIYSIPQQMHSYSGPSFLPPPDQISLGVGTPINMMPAQSPSSSSSGSYKSATETKAPTPPPPPPHLLSSDINSQLIPPPPQFCPPPPPTAFAKSIVSENPNEFLDEIKRAAKERMTRSQDVDAKDKDLEHSSKGAAPMDKTQAAILQAVAKRRSMLEHSDKDNVVNQIEAQIQKTKKLQSAKYYNSGNGVKKEIETLSESKELCREKTSPSPPIPASKPLKQAAPAAVHSTKPVAPAKPKVVVEKVQNKLPAPKPVSAITVTAPAPAKEAKTMLPSNTLPESKKATAEKKTSVEAQKLKERTITTSAKVSDKTKVDGMTKSKDDGTESGEEDFLKKAEKARQMYLQRRSGAAGDKPATDSPTIPAVNTSSVITTPPTSKKTATAARNSTKTSVAMNGEAKKTEPKSLTNKTVQKTNKANLENTKKAAAPVARPQISNGNVKPNRMHIEVQSAGNQKNVDKIGNVSIKDRIASLQKQNGQPISNPNPVKLITLKGVTTSHSHTDPFSSSDSCSTPNDSPYHEINIVAPPPGFGDNDLSSSSSSLADSFNSMPRVHILPAPLSELSISTMPPYGRLPSDNLVPQDDSLSLISSLSTLSTLSTSSTEHPIEIVPPPPSGFEDKASPVSTDQGFEESFIPPPPQFDAYMKNAASTKNSFRNKPVENWFYVDVLDWLESVQMHQYKINFANHCVDGKKLLNLKRNDYITLGVTQVGHRMNLEGSIKKLAMATQQKIPQ